MKPLNLLRWTTRLSAIAALQAGLFFMLTPTRPLQAAIGDEFKICGEELQEAGLSAEEASAACADAIRPKDLSLCVLSMNQEVGIPAEEGLYNCYRDRRPLDLASCVVDINQFLEADDPGIIVENCRRSILPLRYSECVVGLTNTTEQAIDPAIAMEECINADTFPEPFSQ
ncbi:hypothetical protein PCC7418_0087 [Halothece sp. PCC 7418]|uniref:hypothetical protein n=1 Tax=Halothece sp. (strain PCC 7418) TaxID=65093 RepID=UPI0002A07A7D|nr:hypothetical protein [Halothece sp. PCC 7418]AFZ42336.1 hypothetical protein PCC7418_0087 [Halothece sp. PCC 7418]